MTDKVQKIKDWISKTQDGLMDVNGNFENSSNEGAFHILSNLDYYIDSLQEEHVKRTPADVESAMQEVEEKSRAFTDVHKGEDADTILAQMRGEEPVSEDLGDYINKLSKQFPEVSFAKLSRIAVRVAKWQKKQCNNEANHALVEQIKTQQLCYEKGMADMKQQMMKNIWKPADGDDLPEYDREVIAILDYDFGHYKVVYAHRPNPNGWNGTNIDTGEKENFEPEIYDKGGWNQPHVLYWLDAKLPYEENKIIKEL